MLLYGICTSDIDAIDDIGLYQLVQEFSEFEPDLTANCKSEMKEKEITAMEWADSYEDACGNTGFPALFAHIIATRTHFPIVAADDDDRSYVGLEAGAPWDFTGPAASLHQNGFDLMMHTYLQKVTDRETAHAIPVRWYETSCSLT